MFESPKRHHFPQQPARPARSRAKVGSRGRRWATAGAFLQYSASGLAQLGMDRDNIHEIVDGVIDRTIALSPISVPAGRA